MTDINQAAGWNDVPELSTSTLALGGPTGPMNSQAQALEARTKLLKNYSREALRRSYAEAGYNLVDGSFEEGGVLTSTADVMITASGAGYSWTGVYPGGGFIVDPGTIPAAGYVLRKNVQLRGLLTAGAVFITEPPFNADPLGVVDATAAINAALATGKNVYGVGKFKISAPLTMTARDQKLYINSPGSVLRPYHDGDVVRMTQARQGAHVIIFGIDDAAQPTQPRTGPVGSGIVIGYNGADCQTASVAGSLVHSFYGLGFTHENGAMVDFTQAHAENTTLDGFRWTPNYGDNNHAYIADTHAVNCGGIGYNVISTGNAVDSNNPRTQQFVNAKGFGCGKNFYIGTSANEGTVFSELGLSPDEFGPLAYGNKIRVLETPASFLNWVDNNGQNELQGLDNVNNWTTRRRVTEKDVLNSRFEGYLERYQSAAREWTETVSGTTGGVVVKHIKGTASARVDTFDQIQLQAGEGKITYMKSGVYTFATGSIAANSVYTDSIAAATIGAGAGDTVILTMGNVAVFSELIFNWYIAASGQVMFFIRNPTGSSVNPGTVTVRWVVLRH